MTTEPSQILDTGWLELAFYILSFYFLEKKLADQVAPRFDMLPDGQDHEDPKRPKHGHTATFPAAEKQKI